MNAGATESEAGENGEITQFRKSTNRLPTLKTNGQTFHRQRRSIHPHLQTMFLTPETFHPKKDTAIDGNVPALQFLYFRYAQKTASESEISTT